MIYVSAYTATSMVASDGQRKRRVPLHPDIVSAAVTAPNAGRKESVVASVYATRLQGFYPSSRAVIFSSPRFSHAIEAQNKPSDLCEITAMAAASPSDPLAAEAWHSALKQFELDCGSNVVGKLIMQETKPEHLLDYIQQRQQKESRSRGSKKSLEAGSAGF